MLLWFASLNDSKAMGVDLWIRFLCATQMRWLSAKPMWERCSWTSRGNYEQRCVTLGARPKHLVETATCSENDTLFHLGEGIELWAKKVTVPVTWQKQGKYSIKLLSDHAMLFDPCKRHEAVKTTFYLDLGTFFQAHLGESIQLWVDSLSATKRCS